ncbi:FAD-dependent oxidoreductase [Paucibacter sp. JuS9]|uniref:FAD-dependent oxidoreductase n=1 Tax=Paucibacter sp. JuS9 TaxID=3228748 RepID=UPI0037566D96
MNRAIEVDIAVIGASLGGVMAAWRAAQAGQRVLLSAEHRWLGGQMTAQAVPPDEHRLIEHGGASESYLQFRQAMREHYLSQPDFRDRTAMTEGCNPGDGWVSRLCFEPALAAAWFEQLLQDMPGQHLLRYARPVAVQRTGRRIEAVELACGDERVSVRARYVIDATDTGALLPLAGLPFRLGKEAQAEFDEPAAPAQANPEDQQPVTHVLALRRRNHALPVGSPPPGYEAWRAQGVAGYGHRLFSEYIPGARPGESMRLPLFPQGEALDLWRYRRVIAAHMWETPREEVSLINWAQNDYGLQPLLDGPLSEQQVETAARELSACLLHWLRTEAPRPDGGQGYPELEVAPDITGTPDGLAQHIYVRESRRIVGLSTLTQRDIAHQAGTALEAVNRADSVGLAWYNMDMHPTVRSGQGLNAHVRPFTLPLGCFVPADCDNLLPGCKNIAVSHLVNACTRVHPAEWLIGEVAGLLAAFALKQGLTPTDIHASATARAAFQQHLRKQGIPLHWDEPLLARLS